MQDVERRLEARKERGRPVPAATQRWHFSRRRTEKRGEGEAELETARQPTICGKNTTCATERKKGGEKSDKEAAFQGLLVEQTPHSAKR